MLLFMLYRPYLGYGQIEWVINSKGYSFVNKACRREKDEQDYINYLNGMGCSHENAWLPNVPTIIMSTVHCELDRIRH